MRRSLVFTYRVFLFCCLYKLSLFSSYSCAGFQFECKCVEWQTTGIIKNITLPSSSAVIHCSGKYILTTNSEYGLEVVTLWECEKSGLIHKIRDVPKSQYLIQVKFSCDGKYIITTSDDKTVLIFQLIDEEWMERGEINHDCIVSEVEFSPDGQHIITICYADNFKIHKAEIWMIDKQTFINKAVISHKDELNSACFSPNGRFVITASKDGCIKIWGKVKCSDKNGRLFAVEEWEPLDKILNQYGAYEASFSPLGSYCCMVVAANKEEKFIYKIQSLDDGKRNFARDWIFEQDESIVGAIFSRDEKHIALYVQKNRDDLYKVYIFKFIDTEWKCKATICHEKAISLFCFSHNGIYIATASHDKHCKIWGQENHDWVEKADIIHTDIVCTSRFSHDGNYLITASLDKTTQVWAVDINRSWSCCRIIQHDIRLLNALFFQDGVHIMVVSDVGILQIWKLVKMVDVSTQTLPLVTKKEGIPNHFQ